MSGSDIKFWGDKEDHQQVPVRAVQPIAGDSSCAEDASRADLPATALQAAGVSVAGAGTKATSLAPLAPLSPTEKESEKASDCGTSDGDGFLSAAASGGDGLHREEVGRDFSNRSGEKGGLNPEGKKESGGGTTGEKYSGNNGAGNASANLKVCIHADRPRRYSKTTAATQWQSTA